jgi:hypothetical protein
MSVESDTDDLVPVFMPALVVLLAHAEDKKGTPLTKDEVHAIRDSGACIIMEAGDARKMDDSRGFGNRHVVTPEELMDWMVNENGRLTGGFSLRYKRARMSDAEKLDFDQYIGVTEYA